MRDFKKMWILPLSICLFLITATHVSAADLVVVGEEFAPFEFIDKGKVVGIDVDIATHIFKEMGIPVKFRILPWKRAWQKVETGEADAVFSTSRKQKREAYLWYPKEDMWVSEFVFFTKTDKKQSGFKGYETAIKNRSKVGIISGNSYHSSFWKAFPYTDGSTSFQGEKSKMLNKQLDGVSNLKKNLRKLAAGGRIDLFPADKVFGAYTSKMLGLQNKISYYDTVLYSKPYPMPFVKNSSFPNIKNVADEFDLKLQKLKKSGKYQAFFDKWLK